MERKKKHNFELNGEKVFLRPWKTSDERALKKLVSDKSIAKFTSIPFPYNPKLAKEYIQRSAKKLKKKDEFHFGIFSKETGELAGNISIIRTEWKHKKVEIGYWLGKKFRKKGLMAEAVQLMLEFAFKKLKLNRVKICCSTKNKTSKKLIEKTGAKYEGTEREALVNGLDKKHDTLVYSILAKEYKKKKEGTKK